MSHRQNHSATPIKIGETTRDMQNISEKPGYDNAFARATEVYDSIVNKMLGQHYAYRVGCLHAICYFAGLLGDGQWDETSPNFSEYAAGWTFGRETWLTHLEQEAEQKIYSARITPGQARRAWRYEIIAPDGTRHVWGTRLGKKSEVSAYVAQIVDRLNKPIKNDGYFSYSENCCSDNHVFRKYYPVGGWKAVKQRTGKRYTRRQIYNRARKLGLAYQTAAQAANSMRARSAREIKQEQ